MNKKRAGVATFLIIVGILIWFWKRPLHQSKSETAQSTNVQPVPSPAAPATTSAQGPQGIVIPDVPGADLTPEDKMKIGKIVEVFSAPIDFWGKVIDQHGDPVPKAAIHYSFADKYFKDGTKRTGIADDQGFFSLNDGRGAGVYVSVYKEHYYGTPQSAGSFGYGMPVGGKPPSKDNPAIFVLHKMGETEPLIKIETGGVSVQKDGTPKKLSVRNERGRLSAPFNGDLQIELWSGYQPPPPHGRRYDWRVRISVPNGGLIERKGAFNFVAPKDGYLPEFEFTMPGTTDRWRPSIDKEFFLQLVDGCYARVKLGVHAGGDVFVVLESYLNPKPGSRNLEFDPQQNVNAAKP